MAYKNPAARLKRSVTLLKEIACKVCELEGANMKMVLVTRHSKDAGQLVWDAFSHKADAKPHRELVWRGKNAHPEVKSDEPFTLFSRRLEESGAALFLISDTKHNEQYELAIIFDESLKITGVRKGDLMGNDFYRRVHPQCSELSSILKFDREISRVLNNGD